MATKPKSKMTISERAKQFMPFSPLKGLEEALAKKEQEYVTKREPTEEQATIINATLQALNAHDNVCVSYYSDGKNHTVIGEITSIDKVFCTLEINGQKILFKNILSIKEF